MKPDFYKLISEISLVYGGVESNLLVYYFSCIFGIFAIFKISK